MQTKTCTKCGETKPVEEFSKNSRSSNGFRSRCKVCLAAASRRYHQEHREAAAAYYQKYKEQRAAWKRRYRQEHKEAAAAYDRRYHQEYKEAAAERSRQLQAFISAVKEIPHNTEGTEA